jgi:hypothetical protein
MSYDYLDDAVAELAAATGSRPTSNVVCTVHGAGEFTVAEAVADIAAVLDGWVGRPPT